MTWQVWRVAITYSPTVADKPTVPQRCHYVIQHDNRLGGILTGPHWDQLRSERVMSPKSYKYTCRYLDSPSSPCITNIGPTTPTAQDTDRETVVSEDRGCQLEGPTSQVDRAILAAVPIQTRSKTEIREGQCRATKKTVWRTHTAIYQLPRREVLSVDNGDKMI